LWKDGKAEAAKLEPSAIQPLYESAEYAQPIDAGSKEMGSSAAAEKEELYAAEAELRAGAVDLLSARRAFTSARRNGKTRRRKPRLGNRVRTKHKGRLAPSIENKDQARIQESYAERPSYRNPQNGRRCS
jgi:N6-L-threonylcarbamoyladenine synthase